MLTLLDDLLARHFTSLFEMKTNKKNYCGKGIFSRCIFLTAALFRSWNCIFWKKRWEKRLSFNVKSEKVLITHKYLLEQSSGKFCHIKSSLERLQLGSLRLAGWSLKESFCKTTIHLSALCQYWSCWSLYRSVHIVDCFQSVEGKTWMIDVRRSHLWLLRWKILCNSSKVAKYRKNRRKSQTLKLKSLVTSSTWKDLQPAPPESPWKDAACSRDKFQQFFMFLLLLLNISTKIIQNISFFVWIPSSCQLKLLPVSPFFTAFHFFHVFKQFFYTNY